MLLEDKEADVVEAIELARAYNVKELQLSHSIIMDIDEINEDPARAERIRGYIELIHAAYVSLVHPMTHPAHPAPTQPAPRPLPRPHPNPHILIRTRIRAPGA